MTHSIELLETEREDRFDIRVDGYVHKRHKNMTEEAANECIRALRTYYKAIGEGFHITRPYSVV